MQKKFIICGLLCLLGFFALTPVAAQGSELNKVFALAEAAAKQGDVEAMMLLADEYEGGEYLPQNYAKALYWYEQAAKAGEAQAMYMLGVMHYNGRGVKVSETKAMEWFLKGAGAGHGIAQYNAGVFYKYGYGAEKTKDFCKALPLFQQSAQWGYVGAYYELGEMYEKGLCTQINLNTALQYYQVAANNGLDKAAPAVARVRQALQTPAAKPAQQATNVIQQLEARAQKGDTSAMVELGDRYLEGKGVSINHTKSSQWYKAAAERGNAEGQYSLGMNYLYGSGVNANYDDALKWLRAAAAQGHKDAIRAVKDAEIYNEIDDWFWEQ